MSIEHSTIADADRHEAKGASSASAGTVCIANGDGTTTFNNVSYGDLIDTPILGSASEHDETDFATSIQGTTADNALPKAGGIMTGPIQVVNYTLATLPSAVIYNRYLIVVSDATSGPALCISNGTSWIDIRTNAVVV